MANTRELKLTKKYSSLANRKYREVPQLSLAGLWLQEAGFQIGQNVTISIKNEKIIIERT